MVEEDVRLDTEPVVAEKLPIEPVVAEEQQAERAEDSPQLDVMEEPTLEPEPPRNPNAKWYILQAHTGYEGRVEQTIREKLRIKGLGELVDEIFIPS